MAPTVYEVCNKDPMLEVEISEFVDDLVRYVFEFLEFGQAPHVTYRPTAFTDNIGKAVLELMQNSGCVNFNTWCRRVIASCRSVPRPTFQELTTQLHHLMSDRSLPVNINLPSTYIRLFIIACKLCVKFFRAQNLEGVRATKESLKRILRALRTDFCDFCVLDRHAVRIRESLRTRRYLRR